MGQSDHLRHVFIGGCPRSGTTLLASLMSRQPDLFAVPESQFKTDVLFEARVEGWTMDKAADAIRRHWRFRMWNVDLPGEYHGEWNTRSFSAIVDDCFRALRQAEYPSLPAWVVDHTPDNIIWCKTLADLFPDSYFIHIVRDPRAVAASVLPLDWGPNTARQASLWWMKHLFHGLLLERSLTPGRILRVRYEDLVADPDRVVNEVNAFLGTRNLSSEESPHAFQLPGYTVRQHALVGGPVRQENAARWRTILKTREIKAIEHELQDAMPLLGYDLVFPQQKRPRASHMLSWWDFTFDYLLLGRNYLRHLARRASHKKSDAR